MPRPLLAELRRRGHRGETYAQIIRNALNALDKERFLDGEYDAYLDAVQGRDTLHVV